MGYRKYNPGTKIAAVQMLAQSYSRPSICEALGFSISRQSVDRWMQIYNATQRVIRDPSEYEKRGPTRLLTTEDRVFIKELIRCEPGLAFMMKPTTLLSLATLHRNLVKDMEITLKKANTVNVRKSLVAKNIFVESMATVPADYLVFTDESSICSKDLLRNFSRSTKGDQADRSIIDPNATQFTLIPAIGFNGLLALTVTNQNVKGRNFAHFLKYALLPQMNRYPDINSVLVLDNARIHGGERIVEFCQNAGVKLMFLPTYSPELNPIEMCFSQVKSDLRRTQALVGCANSNWEIERTTYWVISASLCHKLYKHAGYNCPEIDASDSDNDDIH
ncbi:hypothetical protein PTTG_25301 [Puccinia triticina 1-1 BBBD Race 1]|uniref:DDE_3 domain-containing protein n=1 Tax=Puccinia triticina (isolate 1-1 / race 1 (BBBD)) TaxID=630390 RepID=A0A180H466_PUCT1|nr:hypothetical protein PTTG_25301 [Puccinia triticina 1-1 BBBD Race 1]